MENWRSYYKNLYRKAEEKEIMENDCDEIEDELKTSKEMQEDTIDKDITFKELVEAVYALKTNTAAGSDSILSNDIVELLRISNENESWKTVEVLEFIHKIIQHMWKAEKVPEKLKEIVIKPFLKKPDKDPTKPGNYRPVALLNVLMKLYEHIIKERLTSYLDKTNYLSNTQAAYRKRRSTVDNILILQEVFYYFRYKTGARRLNKNMVPLYLAFMDLSKAFDRVPRDKLFKKLWKAGVRGKIEK